MLARAEDTTCHAALIVVVVVVVVFKPCVDSHYNNAKETLQLFCSSQWRTFEKPILRMKLPFSSNNAHHNCCNAITGSALVANSVFT